MRAFFIFGRVSQDSGEHVLLKLVELITPGLQVGVV